MRHYGLPTRILKAERQTFSTMRKYGPKTKKRILGIKILSFSSTKLLYFDAANSAAVLALGLDPNAVRRYWRLDICQPVEDRQASVFVHGFWRELKRAAAVAKIGEIATHAFRHTYRTWLDSIGTPVGVQQRLMRHADIRTTMNQYGNALTSDMQKAQGKVIQLVFKSA